MHKHLKHFLLSVGCAIIVVLLLFFALPFFFASAFSGGLLPFGGLIGLVVFSKLLPFLFLFVILLFGLVPFLLVKEDKWKASLVSIAGLLVVFALVFGVVFSVSYAKISSLQQEHGITLDVIREAATSGDYQKCWDLSPFEENGYYRDRCYSWVAKTTHNYTLCGFIKDTYRSRRAECWTLAAVKTGDLAYCNEINTTSSSEFTLANCYTSVGKKLNSTAPCDIVQEHYDRSGWYASRCYEHVAAFVNATPYDPTQKGCQDEVFCAQCDRYDLEPHFCDYDYQYFVEGY